MSLFQAYMQVSEVDSYLMKFVQLCVSCYCCYVFVIVGLKQLPRALELFLQGLTAPTFVWSAITAATYKKYVLVSLIHNGKQPLACMIY